MKYKVSPDQWSPTTPSYYGITMGGYDFDIQGPAKAWSIKGLDTSSVRFELRDNDRASWDVSVGHPVERDELAATSNVIANRVPVEISYGFTVEPGPASTASFLVMGQLHQDNYVGAAPGAGPPFVISLSGEKPGTPGERMVIGIHYGSDTDPQTKVLFVDTADISRGHQYDMKISAIFDPSGNGRLVVQRDGVTIVDYTGPLGYQQQNGVYWAEGIYRSDNASETIAADYSHLQITTGSGVKLPPATAFIDKPVLQVAQADPHLGANATASVQMAGTAKVGTTVYIFDGSAKVGTATVDATGHFQTTVSVAGLGAHGLTAYATDATGRMGITSGPTTILIGSAADVVAKLGTLSAGNIGSIVLTGEHVLHLTSASQLYSAQKIDAGALSTIAGGYGIALSETVTGQSYDRRDSTYTSDGKLVELARWTGQKLVFDQTWASDGSTVVKSWAADGSSTVNMLTAAGFSTTYERYDAKAAIVSRQDFRTDGTSTLHNYNAAGAEVSVVNYAADKSRVQTDTVAGQAYTKQVYVYDAAGHLVSQERFTAAGTKIYSQIVAADGSRTLTTVATNGTSEFIAYAANGTMLRDERFYADGHVSSDQVYRSDGSNTLYRYAADGTATGTVVTAADRSRVQTDTGIKNLPYTTQTFAYDAANHLLSQERFAANGTKIFSQTWNPDASSVVHQYAATTGKETASTFTASDGSRILTTFGITGQPYAAQALHYEASGRASGFDRFDAGGRMIASEVWNADGSKKIMSLDAAGHATGFTVVATDKSHTDTVYAPGTTTAASTISYDSAGHLVTKQTFNAAGELATGETWAANGSHVTSTYSHSVLVKASAYDGLGKLVSETLYGASAPTSAAAATALSRVTALDVQSPSTSREVDLYDAKGALVSVSRWVGDTLVHSETTRPDGSRTVDDYDAMTGAKTRSAIFNADHSTSVYTFSTGGPVTKQLMEYDTDGRLVETVRWSGDRLISTQEVASDGSQTVRNWDNPDQLSVKHYAASGSLVSIDRFNANGVEVSSDLWKADGTHEVHSFNSVTGAETNYVIFGADGSKEVATLGITNRPYATQHLFYNASGALERQVNHYGSDAGPVAFDQHLGPGGASDANSYDLFGRLTNHTVITSSQTRDVTAYTYAGTGATPVSVREDVFDSSNHRTLTDLTASDGSHTVTAFAANVTLQSHAAVADVFTSFGNDTFVFGAGSGQDTIKNFHVASTALHDFIQIDQSIATDFAHLAMHASGNNTVIDLGAHDTVTLVNVHMAQLSAHDFAFV